MRICSTRIINAEYVTGFTLVFNYVIYLVKLQSIVICVSVCLSTRISPEPHARSLPIFVHVAYGRGSVLLRQGDKIRRGRGSFGGFLSNDNALYSMATGTYKNG